MPVVECRPTNQKLLDKLLRYSRQENECRVWTRYRDVDGYGTIRVSKKKIRAHRVAWELANGEIPTGVFVLHACDNPSCIFLGHLFLGTHQDNMLDMTKKNRQAFGNRNGSRTHPERVPRGERHGSRLHPERVARGERNGRAKLTKEDVDTIRAEYSRRGITQRELGNKFGVNGRQISHIVNGKSWSDRECVL